MRENEARLVLFLLLIVWKSGAKFVNQSRGSAKRNQTNVNYFRHSWKTLYKALLNWDGLPSSVGPFRSPKITYVFWHFLIFFLFVRAVLKWLAFQFMFLRCNRSWYCVGETTVKFIFCSLQYKRVASLCFSYCVLLDKGCLVPSRLLKTVAGARGKTKEKGGKVSLVFLLPIRHRVALVPMLRYHIFAFRQR